jgi:cell shape-determining protein MreD
MTWLPTILVLGLAFFGVFLTAVWDGPRLWLGASPSLLPPLVVFAALRAELATISLLAVLGGLWTDALSANPLGVSVLPLFGIGLGLHRWRDVILRDLSYAQFVLGLVASAAVPGLTLLLILTGGNRPLVDWHLLGPWVAGALVGGGLTPACFWGLGWAQAQLAGEVPAAPSFRADREIKRGRY